jgi:hypothetical protein
MSTIHMRIVQNHELIADLPEWPGPVPRVGDYIYHPPRAGRPQDVDELFNVAGCVKCVKWRTPDRTEDGNAFVMTARPFVEITL